jgi:alpha-beta hydrolase superfamily lysophospholipase
MIRRFKLAALALVLALGPVAPALAQTAAAAAPAAAPAIAASHVELTAPGGRVIDLSVWQAADERGVVVFSHGFNGSPAAYSRILSAWVADGFTVVAPLHVDSLRHPDHARYDNQAAFTTRLVDLAVTRGFVRGAHAGKPIIAAGHSFGSLMSLIEGGAVTVAGPHRDPDVRAVIAFSSAGDLPGVILPDTYADLRTPTLMITGDADLVEGYVTDWRAHRGPFDRSPPGDKMLLVFAGADHSLVRSADADDFDMIVRTTTDWLEAYGLDDAAARDRLAALKAPDGVTLERR